MHSEYPSFYPVEGVYIQEWLAEGKLAYSGGGEPNEGDGNKLAWSFVPWPAEGITRTYHARPIACGRFRASEEAPSARIEYNDTFWSSVPDSVIAFGNPVLDVPCQPTPTEVVPSPSPTAVTPTPPTTPSPVSTEDRIGARLHLPLALNRACAVASESVDVVIALDVSGSMVYPADELGGVTRMEAARIIALDMVDHLVASRDRVAIVFYGDHELIQVRAPLADCCGPARMALEQVPLLNGSRMDLALAEAERQLSGPAARPQSDKVVVVLTDGDLNQTPLSELVSRASSLRASGARLHVVAVGDVADRDLFTSVVGAPGQLHLTREMGPAALDRLLGALPRCRR
jgi:hypothetical protein